MTEDNKAGFREKAAKAVAVIACTTLVATFPLAFMFPPAPVFVVMAYALPVLPAIVSCLAIKCSADERNKRKGHNYLNLLGALPPSITLGPDAGPPPSYSEVEGLLQTDSPPSYGEVVKLSQTVAASSAPPPYDAVMGLPQTVTSSNPLSCKVMTRYTCPDHSSI